MQEVYYDYDYSIALQKNNANFKNNFYQEYNKSIKFFIRETTDLKNKLGILFLFYWHFKLAIFARLFTPYSHTPTYLIKLANALHTLLQEGTSI